jgi:ElaB/YqjD/DUF883 family membrane-anchored ribosome-binding protein
MPTDKADTAGVLQRVTDDLHAYRGSGPDPLLTALTEAAAQRAAARQRMRLLLAYAREYVRPRPYKLADLASAAGLSISGVRIAYDQHDITTVANRLHTSSQRPPTST